MGAVARIDGAAGERGEETDYLLGCGEGAQDDGVLAESWIRRLGELHYGESGCVGSLDSAEGDSVEDTKGSRGGVPEEAGSHRLGAGGWKTGEVEVGTRTGALGDLVRVDLWHAESHRD